jgi:hypothetical protein
MPASVPLRSSLRWETIKATLLVTDKLTAAEIETTCSQ